MSFFLLSNYGTTHIHLLTVPPKNKKHTASAALLLCTVYSRTNTASAAVAGDSICLFLTTMDHLGLTALSPSPLSSALALVASPRITRRYRWVNHHDGQQCVRKHRQSIRAVGPRRPVFQILAAAEQVEQPPASEGSGGTYSEQKAGFQPPSPLEDDGHRVDISSLQDLVDSGG